MCVKGRVVWKKGGGGVKKETEILRETEIEGK